MIQHILFPIDGTPLDRSVIPLLREVLPADAHVTVLHVFRAPTRSPVRFADEWPLELVENQKAAQAIADEERSILEQAGIAPVTTATFEGAPGPTICSAAEVLTCDAIFMGTSGDRGDGALNARSVSEYVLNHASVPVLLLHPAPGVSGSAFEQAPEAPAPRGLVSAGNA